MDTSFLLNPLEIDALTELVNIGVGSAASSLREMVGREVILAVPNVKLLPRANAVEVLQQGAATKLVAVHQVFDGDISGRAMLIFPESNSMEIVRAVSGGDLPIEDIMELEHEALAETGNIIINDCLATIANLLGRSLKMSLPEVHHGEAKDFFSLSPLPAGGDLVLFVYINFAVRHHKINGYIALLMDMPSIVGLKVLLHEFIERVAGSIPPGSSLQQPNQLPSCRL
jgi:chemotaxis protein CheC